MQRHESLVASLAVREASVARHINDEGHGALVHAEVQDLRGGTSSTSSTQSTQSTALRAEQPRHNALAVA
jgi:hypothetical protein